MVKKGSTERLLDWLLGFQDEIDWGFHMNKEAWEQVRRFKPEEFENPDEMDSRVIFMLDSMLLNERNHNYPGLVFIIHDGGDFRPGDSGTHGKGYAIDGHFEIRGQDTGNGPLELKEQFILVMRYHFSGVGIYPYWNSPGVHVDVAPLMNLTQRKRLWWRNKEGVYRPVEEFFNIVA